MEAVAAAPFNGKADLPEIASDLQMEIDELFPVAETLQMLRFAEVEGGDLKLTEDGMAFAQSDIDERKRIFPRHCWPMCRSPRIFAGCSTSAPAIPRARAASSTKWRTS